MLAIRRAGWGSLLTAAGTLGYYGAYAFLAWRAVSGELTIGDLTFLAGLLPPPAQPARGPPDRLLPGRRPGALPRRPLLLLRPPAGDRLEARRRALPAADTRRLRLRRRRLPLSRRRALGGAPPHLHPAGRRGAGAGGRKRRRQDHPGQAAGAPLRPRRRAHPARRPRPARLRPGRPAQPGRASFSRISCATP